MTGYLLQMILPQIDRIDAGLNRIFMIVKVVTKISHKNKHEINKT